MTETGGPAVGDTVSGPASRVGGARTAGADFYQSRSQDLEKFKAEFRSVRLSSVIPLAAWMNDRPWNLLWVRWFIFFALFPLAVATFFGHESVTLGNAAWALGIYFAAVWLVVFSLYMRPERVPYEVFAQVWFFTVIAGIFLVLTVQKWPVISLFYKATESPDLTTRWLGYVFGVGILEEGAKALPLFLFVFRRRPAPGPLTFAYLGAMSGLAFGVAEAVSYSYMYANHLQLGSLGFGDYVVVQILRLITLPLLHAMFSAVVGYFMGLASLYTTAPRALIVIGLGLAALLHGTYDTFSSGWAGVGVALVTLLVFISYVRTSDRIQQELLGTPGGPASDTV